MGRGGIAKGGRAPTTRDIVAGLEKADVRRAVLKGYLSSGFNSLAEHVQR